jgi:hypothetical protein
MILILADLLVAAEIWHQQMTWQFCWMMFVTWTS